MPRIARSTADTAAAGRSYVPIAGLIRAAMRCSAGGLAFGKVVTIGRLNMRQVTNIVHLVAVTGLGIAAITAERVVLAMSAAATDCARRTACRYRTLGAFPVVAGRIRTLSTIPAANLLITIRTIRFRRGQIISLACKWRNYPLPDASFAAARQKTYLG